MKTKRHGNPALGNYSIQGVLNWQWVSVIAAFMVLIKEVPVFWCKLSY